MDIVDKVMVWFAFSSCLLLCLLLMGNIHAEDYTEAINNLVIWLMMIGILCIKQVPRKEAK